MSPNEKPDYGVDAPGVVRNLLMIGGALLAVAVAATLRWIPRIAEAGGVRVDLIPSTLPPGLALVGTGFAMLYGSKRGKFDEREKLLGRIEWKGIERVLDVGCGRGLMMLGAAKKLTTGRATGIDIWRAEDLAGNRAGAVLENARIEGVSDRVSIETADMRKMPFGDGSFDVIVSRAAIHNLDAREDRAAAIREIARVLRPGGTAVIDDIRHHDEYAAAFEQCGVSDVRLVGSPFETALWTLVTFGSLRPNTIVARKEK